MTHTVQSDLKNYSEFLLEAHFVHNLRIVPNILLEYKLAGKRASLQLKERGRSRFEWPEQARQAP